MFRRTAKVDDAPLNHSGPKGPGAKGRPTPTRKEAETARRERAKAGLDKKSAQKRDRQRRMAETSRARQGLRSGDERYLPQRDKGPVKRYIRDYVDARISIAEFLLPLLVVIMVMQYSGSKDLIAVSSTLWTVTILMVAVDTAWMLFRLKRQLRAKYPDESLKGTTFYTILRVVQLRWLRMPKPKVKIGGGPR